MADIKKTIDESFGAESSFYLSSDSGTSQNVDCQPIANLSRAIKNLNDEIFFKRTKILDKIEDLGNFSLDIKADLDASDLLITNLIEAGNMQTINTKDKFADVFDLPNVLNFSNTREVRIKSESALTPFGATLINGLFVPTTDYNFDIFSIRSLYKNIDNNLSYLEKLLRETDDKGYIVVISKMTRYIVRNPRNTRPTLEFIKEYLNNYSIDFKDIIYIKDSSFGYEVGKPNEGNVMESALVYTKELIGVNISIQTAINLGGCTRDDLIFDIYNINDAPEIVQNKNVPFFNSNTYSKEVNDVVLAIFNTKPGDSTDMIVKSMLSAVEADTDLNLEKNQYADKESRTTSTDNLPDSASNNYEEQIEPPSDMPDNTAEDKTRKARNFMNSIGFTPQELSAIFNDSYDYLRDEKNYVDLSDASLQAAQIVESLIGSSIDSIPENKEKNLSQLTKAKEDLKKIKTKCNKILAASNFNVLKVSDRETLNKLRREGATEEDIDEILTIREDITGLDFSFNDFEKKTLLDKLLKQKEARAIIKSKGEIIKHEVQSLPDLKINKDHNKEKVGGIGVVSNMSYSLGRFSDIKEIIRSNAIKNNMKMDSIEYAFDVMQTQIEEGKPLCDLERTLSFWLPLLEAIIVTNDIFSFSVIPMNVKLKYSAAAWAEGTVGSEKTKETYAKMLWTSKNTPLTPEAVLAMSDDEFNKYKQKVLDDREKVFEALKSAKVREQLEISRKNKEIEESRKIKTKKVNPPTLLRTIDLAKTFGWVKKTEAFKALCNTAQDWLDTGTELFTSVKNNNAVKTTIEVTKQLSDWMGKQVGNINGINKKISDKIYEIDKEVQQVLDYTNKLVGDGTLGVSVLKCTVGINLDFHLENLKALADLLKNIALKFGVHVMTLAELLDLLNTLLCKPKNFIDALLKKPKEDCNFDVNMFQDVPNAWANLSLGMLFSITFPMGFLGEIWFAMLKFLKGLIPDIKILIPNILQFIMQFLNCLGNVIDMVTGADLLTTVKKQLQWNSFFTGI